MKTLFPVLLFLSTFVGLSQSSRAGVAVTVGHNADASAAGDFHFSEAVPPPRPTAALGAAFKVVDGVPDENSASIDVLHDGKLPDEEDQPEANFFFQDESDGGRWLVDLGKVIPIREVDTYSRHPDTRAVQVYKLYGSEGTALGFAAEPKRPQDPAQSGWKLLATVDTRTRFNGEGGQYGVRVADTAGPLGSYRYLLFDVARTEDEDTFGNTFFSEINVAEAIWMGLDIEPATEVLRAQLSLEPDGGLAVREVAAGSPAAKAGLQKNDVLTGFDDQPLVTPVQLHTLLVARHTGDTVRVSYVRRGQPRTAEVKLEADPRPAGQEAAAPDKVVVTINHNEGSAATGSFKFQTVPSPRPNAARDAAFYAKGDPDENSAPLDVLHDGKLPDAEDQPEANFFFRNGSDGGGLMLDLGKTIAVQEVDTYSWHPGTRAPQVYKLLGRESDDEKSEWKRIADVDTRRQFGQAGGQYGVRLAAGSDGIIGRYRFLCFYVARTEDEDDYGNTFYSEIDVVDRDAPASAPTPPPRRAAETFNYDRQGLHLTFTDNSAGCDPKERERLVDTFFTVYPQMVAEFNHDAPKSAKILFDPGYHGIAATEGATMHCNPTWFRDHPEDLDTLTHEGMHVVQQYRQWQPGWVTEGIADYARAKFGVNNAATGWTMPEYNAAQSYKDAYRITARFFLWLEKHVRPGIVVALDQAMREGKYTPEFWTQQTGKSVDELWQDYGKNPAL